MSPGHVEPTGGGWNAIVRKALRESIPMGGGWDYDLWRYNWASPPPVSPENVVSVDLRVAEVARALGYASPHLPLAPF